MSRPLRIEFEGAFYHVINRGLERREIFRSPQEYEYFLRLLSQVALKYGLNVHSYCLMPNHYHLYVETPNAQLSKIMRQIDGNYTQKFNKRRNRVGPLMQGRYKAVLVEEDSYSLRLSKYIHLNPVKAKIVKKPEEYQWSSYSAFVGKAKVPDFLKTDWLLGQLHKSRSKAIRALKVFTLQSEEEDWVPEQDVYKGLILGKADFISSIQSKHLPEKQDKEIPKLKQFQKRKSPEQIRDFIDSLKPEKNVSKKLLIYALKTHAILTLKEIGDQTGKLHYSAVSQTAKRLLKQSETDKKLFKLISQIDEFCRMSNVKT